MLNNYIILLNRTVSKAFLVACYCILAINPIALATQNQAAVSSSTESSSSEKITFSTALASHRTPADSLDHMHWSYRKTGKIKPSGAALQIPIKLYLMLGNRLGTTDESFDKNPVSIDLGSIAISAELGTILEFGAAIAIDPLPGFRLQMQSTYMTRSFIDTQADNNQLSDNNTAGDLTKSSIDMTAFLRTGNRLMVGLGLAQHFNIKFRRNQHVNPNLQDYSGDDANGWHIAVLMLGKRRISSEFSLRFSAIKYVVPYLNRTINESTIDFQWLYPLY